MSRKENYRPISVMKIGIKILNRKIYIPLSSEIYSVYTRLVFHSKSIKVIHINRLKKKKSYDHINEGRKSIRQNPTPIPQKIKES